MSHTWKAVAGLPLLAGALAAAPAAAAPSAVVDAAPVTAPPPPAVPAPHATPRDSAYCQSGSGYLCVYSQFKYQALTNAFFYNSNWYGTASYHNDRSWVNYSTHNYAGVQTQDLQEAGLTTVICLMPGSKASNSPTANDEGEQNIFASTTTAACPNG